MADLWEYLMGGGEQTTTLQYLSPNYTPEQQSVQDLLNQNIFQSLTPEQYDPLADMIYQYYGIEEPVSLQQVLNPLGYDFSDPYYRKIIETGNLSKKEREELIGAVKEFQLRKSQGYNMGSKGYWFNGPAQTFQQALESKGISPELVSDLSQYSAKDIETDLVGFMNLAPEQRTGYQALLQPAPETGEPTPELVTPSLGTTAGEMPPSEQPPWWEQEAYKESPLAKLMTLPKYRQEQFDLARQEGKQTIEDWYNRAMRDVSRRGITESGGYLGSRFEKDVASVLGEGGRRESDLMRQLRQGQIAAETQDVYSLINATENIRRWQESFQLQKKMPWIPVAQSMLPPFSQQQTTTMPGAGLIPMASDIAGIGLGTYALGSGLGWWGGSTASNLPATGYPYNPFTSGYT